MPSVTPRHQLSQPNPHSTDEGEILPPLPQRADTLPEGADASVHLNAAPSSGDIPSPLDADHRALPAPDPLMAPLPPKAPTAPTAPKAPAASGVPPVAPVLQPAIPDVVPDVVPDVASSVVASAAAGMPPAPSPAPAAPAASAAPIKSSPAPRAGATGGPRPRRNPRVLAAMAYALPLIPALVLLLRERRNRFIRVHAAQALVFYLLLAGWQIALFFAAVGVGAVVTDLRTDAIVGLAFLVLFILLAVLSALFWLVLIADAMAGRRTLFPVVSRWAERLERLGAPRLPAVSGSPPRRENVPVP